MPGREDQRGRRHPRRPAPLPHVGLQGPPGSRPGPGQGRRPGRGDPATPRPAKRARVVAKVLASAVANARNNDQLDPDELYVSACYADEGTTLKRWRPRARGRATRIRKRTCHITVIVSRLPEDRLERRRARQAEPRPPACARAGWPPRDAASGDRHRPRRPRPRPSRRRRARATSTTSTRTSDVATTTVDDDDVDRGRRVDAETEWPTTRPRRRRRRRRRGSRRDDDAEAPTPRPTAEDEAPAAKPAAPAAPKARRRRRRRR